MPRRATIYTYPWDLHDQGIDTALDIIADTAGLNSVSLALSYHESTYFLPHNPRRKIYWGEEGAIYFQPDPSYYAATSIHPLVSDLVTGPDYLPDLVEALRRRNLHFAAWMVFCYNHYLPAQYPEAAKHDAFGTLYRSQLCPASPALQAYARALVADIIEHYRPDEINLESLSYLHCRYGFRNPKVAVAISPFHEYLLGLCFCQNCQDAASRSGLDGPAFKAEIAAYLEDHLGRHPNATDLQPLDPQAAEEAFGGRLGRYIDVRVETATQLTLEIIDQIQTAGVSATFFGGLDPLVNGLDSPRLMSQLDGVNASGMGPGRVAGLRSELGPRPQLNAIIHPGGTSQDELRDQVDTLVADSIDGFAFYNYGLLRREQLQWIGACREAWT